MKPSPPLKVSETNAFPSPSSLPLIPLFAFAASSPSPRSSPNPTNENPSSSEQEKSLEPNESVWTVFKKLRRRKLSLKKPVALVKKTSRTKLSPTALELDLQ